MCTEKFNENEFMKREYELLRLFASVEGEFPQETKQRLGLITDEVVENEEWLKYAISVTEDSYGTKQLNGPITTSYMIMELEKINPEISDRLIENLLFEYQDEAKEIPLILTGKRVLGASYLEYLLLNTEYKIKEKYIPIIGKYVTKSIDKVFNATSLTLFFSRRDIPTKDKKNVIDSLDEEVLAILVNEWNESFMKAIVSDLNFDFLDMADEEIEEIEKELESMHEEKVSDFADVMNLINEKLYS